jgi:hypothetical protein
MTTYTVQALSLTGSSMLGEWVPIVDTASYQGALEAFTCATQSAWSAVRLVSQGEDGTATLRTWSRYDA